MTAEARCPDCYATYIFSEHLLGRRANCKLCSQSFVLVSAEDNWLGLDKGPDPPVQTDSATATQPLREPQVVASDRLPQVQASAATAGRRWWEKLTQVKTWGLLGTSLALYLVVLIILAIVTLSMIDRNDRPRVIEVTIGTNRETKEPAEKIVESKIESPAISIQQPALENNTVSTAKKRRPVEKKHEPAACPDPVEEQPVTVEKVASQPKPHPQAVCIERLLSHPDIDHFGNFTGKGYGLARDGQFDGNRILVWGQDKEVIASLFPDDNPLWGALRQKGFKVTIQTGNFSTQWLQSADQLWLFSGSKRTLGDREYEAISSFVREGNGLYLLADDDPAVVEANALAEQMFFTTVSGNYSGAKTLAVQGRGVTRDDYNDYLNYQQKHFCIQNRVSSRTPLPDPHALQLGILVVIANTNHYTDDHPLLTDVNFINEGMTISHTRRASLLKPVLIASSGQVLAAVSRDSSQRVVVDCGYTRYFYSRVSLISYSAGTLLYAENVAAYLAGKDFIEGDTKRWQARKQLLAEFRYKDRAKLLAALEHPDAEQRWAAVTVVSQRGIDEPALFIDRLHDPAQEVRRQAWCALVRLTKGVDMGETEQSIKRWRRWTSVRKQVFKLRSAQISNLKAALESDRALDRWAALMACRNHPRRTSLLPLAGLLVQSLNDPDPWIRTEAQAILVEISEGKNFGPVDSTGNQARLAAVEKWRAWLKPKNEKTAEGKLRLAKLFLNNKRGAAQRRLQEIMENYPQTDAAKEASHLLADYPDDL